MSYLAYNGQQGFNINKRILSIGVICSTFIMVGCASSANKAPKYEAAQVTDENKAIVIIGTKNVSYFDLHRYGPIPTVTKVAVKQTTQAATQKCPEDIKPSKTQKAAESADPMKLDYTDSSFNLKYLFNSNAPSNLGEAIKKQENQDEKKSNNVSTSATTSTSKNENSADAKVVEYRIHKPKFLFNVFNYSKSTYTIEPGIYYISFAFYEHDSNVRFTRLPGVTKDGVVQYGAFNVQPGEVLYLGDIDFDWVNMDKPKMVSVAYHFNDVKKDLLETNHRDLAVKITQAKFYPAGSKIEAQSDGGYVLR